MAFRFIHSADWQIGKVFRFIADAEMGSLQDARLNAIARIGELATEHHVQHVLVAGDVYEHAEITPRARAQPIERMRAYGAVQWHLLPGNHDSYQANGLWDRVARGIPDHIHIYKEPAVAVIEPGVAALLPAPLQHRRGLDDLTEWMDGAHTDDGLIRIGMAHGSVRGFGPDDEQRINPIAPERPERARLDYLALGDWHGEFRVSR